MSRLRISGDQDSCTKRQNAGTHPVGVRGHARKGNSLFIFKLQHAHWSMPVTEVEAGYALATITSVSHVQWLAIFTVVTLQHEVRAVHIMADDSETFPWSADITIHCYWLHSYIYLIYPLP